MKTLTAFVIGFAAIASIIPTRMWAAIMPPTNSYAGRTRAEWSAEWWKWTLTNAADVNPMLDPTGARCHVGQQGPVRFLAGVLNENGFANRSCRIPEGKALFFPILSWECSNVEPPPSHGDNESQMRACAVSQMNQATNMSLEIDGITVTNLASYRVSSPLFSFTLPGNNIAGVPAGPAQAVSDGFFVMVEPLSPGQHTIQFQGTIRGTGGRPDSTLYITYNLTVITASDLVVPPMDSVAGKTQAEWSGEWWKWAFSLPATAHPLFDTAPFFLGQKPPVIFAGGKFCSFENTNCKPETAIRNIYIQRGDYLFFPILNGECSTLEGNGSTEAELRTCAQGYMAGVSNLWVEVDGVAVPNLSLHRFTSPLFSYTLASNDNVLRAFGFTNATDGATSPSVADGYYVMLKPLRVGEHTLRFHGELPEFGFNLDVSYQIVVYHIPKIDSITARDGAVHLKFFIPEGKAYWLDSADSLPFISFDSTRVWGTGEITWIVPAAQQKKFFRLVERP